MTTPPRSKTTAAIALIDAYDTPGGVLRVPTVRDGAVVFAREDGGVSPRR